jgi:hypothetical protein
MRFGPLMYDFGIRRCDGVEGDGERLCEWKYLLRRYSCTIGFIRMVVVTVSESAIEFLDQSFSDVIEYVRFCCQV